MPTQLSLSGMLVVGQGRQELRAEGYSGSPMPKLSQLPWFNIVTALAAAYGAGLSTFNYLAQRRRDRRALKVEIHDPGDKGLFPPILQVNAINTGYRSIHLASVGIILEGSEEIVWAGRFTTDDDLPCELSEGKRFTANIMVNDLSELLVNKGHSGSARLQGQLVDEGGKIYRSRWCKYRMRKWELGGNVTAI